MKRIVSLWAVACLLLALAGCEEKLDPRQLADALSEELTGELDFDNSTEVTGEPPGEHAGDESYPQVESFEAPADITTGVPALIVLRLSPAYADPTDIVGAVAHVVQANKDDAAPSYFDIRPVPPIDLATRQITLTANLIGSVDQFLGNAFRVRFAILRDDGNGNLQVGNYVDWNVVFEPPPGTPTKVPNCCCHQLFNNDGQLSSRNVFFVDPAACRSRLPALFERYMKTGSYQNQIDGGPCPTWISANQGLNTMTTGLTSRMYPSGTRFTPVEALDPQQTDLRQICEMEILCLGERQESPTGSNSARLLAFNNGRIINGAPPPEGQENDPFAEIPLGGINTGSLEVGLGEPYSFTFNFHANPVEAIGAVVVISQADGTDAPLGYIRIDQAPDVDMPDTMSLSALVTESTAAAGHAYRVRIAVLSRTEDGREGICNYADLYLFVRPENGQSTPRRCMYEAATIVNHGPLPSSSEGSPMTPEDIQMTLRYAFEEAFQYVMSVYGLLAMLEMPEGTRVYYPGYTYTDPELGHTYFSPPSILEVQCPESMD
jgi:hypothetical protein